MAGPAFTVLDGDASGYALGDVDGDLRTDLLVRHNADWYLRKGQVNGTLGTALLQSADTPLPPNDSAPTVTNRVLQLADIDLDGDEELVIERATSAVPSLRQLKIFRRVADTGPQWQEAYSLPDAPGAGSNARTRRLSDMNGDGLLDDVRWIKAPITNYPNRGYYQSRAQLSPGVWDSQVTAFPAFNDGPFALFFDSDGDGQVELHQDLSAYQIRGASIETRRSNRTSQSSCDVMLDYNADGLVDQVSFNSGTWTAYPNTGNGWREKIDGSGAVSVNCNGAMKGYDPGFRVIDYNQDGLQDIIVLHPPAAAQNFAATTTVLISTGTGFTQYSAAITSNVPECRSSTSTPCPAPFTSNTPFSFDASLNNVLDVNGDGLFDVITTYSTDVMNPSSSIRFMLWVQFGPRQDLLTKVEDGNGALVRQVAYAALNDSLATGYTRPTGCVYPILCHLGTEPVVTSESLPDATSSGASPSPSAATPVLAYRHYYQQGRRDVLLGWLGFGVRKSVDQRAGRGGHTVTTTYDQTPVTLSGLRRYPNRGRPANVIDTISGLAEGWIEKTISIQYALKSSIQLNGAVTFFSVPTTVTATEARPGPVAPAVLRQFVTTTLPADVDQYGNVLKTTTDLGGGRRHETVTTFVPPDLTLPASSADRKGWLIKKPDNVKVTAYAPPLASDDPASITRGVSYSYDNNGGAPWRVKDIRRDEDNTPQLVSVVSLCTRVTLYDIFGQPQLVDVTPGTCLPGPSTRSTSISYDADGVYPAAITKYGDSINLTTSLSIDPRFGVPGSLTDENGLVTQYSYDGFGRIRRVDVRPGRSDTTWETIDYLAPSGGFGVVEKVLRSDATYETSYPDRLGQVVRQVESGFLGTDVISDIDYDSLGRLIKRTRPRYAPDPTYVAARYTYDNASRVVSVCQHDATKCVKTSYNGLVTKISDEDDTTSSEIIRQRQVKYAPFGAIEKSTYWTDGVARDTTYVYGHFETLGKVVDPLGNAVRMRYDAYGRQTRLDDEDIGYAETRYTPFDEVASEKIPPTAGETSPSVTTFGYDKFGRLLSRLSADGEDTFEYDLAPGLGKGALSRRTRRTNGTVAGQIPAEISTSFEYTGSGFVSKEKWTVDSEIYEFGYTYDGQGRPLDTIYPRFPLNGAPLRIQNVWNRYGYLGGVRVVTDIACTSDIQCGTSGRCSSGSCYYPGNPPGDPHDLVANTSVDAEFRVRSEQVPGSVIGRTFDAATGRLSEITGRQAVTYAYEPHGNLSQRIDLNGYLNETFTYDDADRLKTTSLSGIPLQSFSYDAIGNLTTSSEGGASCSWVPGEGAAGPHALTSGSCCADVTTHDARGNVVYEGCKTRNSITYGSFNKPTSVQVPTGPREFFSYDAEHTRVRKRVSGGRPQGTEWNEVTTLDGLFERRKGDAVDDWVYYVHANGRVIGQLVQSKQGTGWGPNSGWQFLFQDRLGSVEMATTDRAALVSRGSYGSWGARRNPNGTSEGAPSSIPQLVKRGFTGHPHDDEFAWIDMGGREYNPYTRRFLQPDPLVPDPSYGPSWNRYSYVRNNPQKFRDPTGYYDRGAFSDEMIAQASTIWLSFSVSYNWLPPIFYWDYYEPTVLGKGPGGNEKDPSQQVPPPLRVSGSQVVTASDAPANGTVGAGAPRLMPQTLASANALACNGPACWFLAREARIPLGSHMSARLTAVDVVAGAGDRILNLPVDMWNLAVTLGELTNPLAKLMPDYRLELEVGPWLRSRLGLDGIVSEHSFGYALGGALTDFALILGGGLSGGSRAIAAGEGTGAEGGRILYRYRKGPETATRLGQRAAEAEAGGFPHGVSTTTKPIPGRPCAAASCSDVEKIFPVIKTGGDPNHFTVELPKPVTKGVADMFNALFRQVN